MHFFVVVGVYFKQAIIGLGIITKYFFLQSLMESLKEREFHRGFDRDFHWKFHASSRTFCKTYKIYSNVPTKSLMGYSIGKINGNEIVDGIKNLMRYFSTTLFYQQFYWNFSIPIKSSIYADGIFHQHFSFF